MTTKDKILSKTRLQCLRAQGYRSQSDQSLSDMAFGIRFAYRLCTTIIIVAILTQRVELFSAMLMIAFMGIVLPNHPFDYIYNYMLSKWMNKPKVPPRAKQLKFACTIATIWLAAVVYTFSIGYVTTALILAGMLALVASLPSTIDICVPSVIYNALFERQSKTSKVKAS